jgi:hypothetical protein
MEWIKLFAIFYFLSQVIRLELFIFPFVNFAVYSPNSAVKLEDILHIMSDDNISPEEIKKRLV